MAELSPMMKQYFQIKDSYSDTILMFRVGDFYEMFFDDAKTASRELDLVLTGKDCGMQERAPMCGVPFHSVDNYISRLVSHGYKVAICEQTEDPAKTKGIVKRDVIRVITPGTAFDSAVLNEGKNNYLACVYTSGKTVAVAFCDISTGLLDATLFTKDAESEAVNELLKYEPKEVLINKSTLKLVNIKRTLTERLGCAAEVYEDEEFKLQEMTALVLSHFGVKNADELGVGDKPQCILAVGKVMEYLKQTQKNELEGIKKLNVYSSAQFMKLDSNTVKNLELLENMRDREKRASLLWVLDKTKTAMGKRLLRSWVEKPLISPVQIGNRLDAVQELFGELEKREEIRTYLTSVLDIERIISRIIYKTANAKELRSIKRATENLPAIKGILTSCKSSVLSRCGNGIDVLSDVAQLIDSAIVEDPPLSVREGGMIKRGFNEELDSLKDIMENGKGFLSDIERREQEKTGIKKLRIGYNKVYGYFIEVTNSFKDLVPETYIRKQTLTNAERYITQELKELEDKIIGAKDRSVRLESELFFAVRDKVGQQLERIQKTAFNVAVADCIQSLAQAAEEGNYVRPDVDDKDEIIIKSGRHPVVEKMMSDAPFVPNDTALDCRDNRMIIITGPNMAGKSTFMRQVAVITVMAHIGSFVPAEYAKIGITDAVFTRVGASDDLSSGRSTFMVEMSEVASILKNATKKSLIIYDEIGRGTSTFDGMSIARAVLEYTADKKRIGAKTLFATHYHELTEIENECEGVKNYNIAVKKRGGDIVFLRRIVPGGTDDSYGIDVAKLAGIPKPVIDRANDVLGSLEETGTQKVIVKSAGGDAQLTFGNSAADEIAEELKKLDVNTLTPIEAMEKLYKFSKLAKES